MVTRTDKGKNNDTMNIALKIIGPLHGPMHFYFSYKRIHFQFLWFVKSLELFWLDNFHKNFLFPYFYENYNKCGHGHLP